MQKDVVIIGAGPVGLFAIFQCGMLGLKTHIFDALPSIGGQCTALYPEKPIYDIPGFPTVDAGDLISHLETQAAPFEPSFSLKEEVVSLEKISDGWRVTGSKSTVVTAKAVIIAAGVGAFGPNRPPLEGIEDFEGQSVHYMVRRRRDFADQDILIAGGGDSAVDWAISLSEVAKSVKLLHRRDKFRAAPESVSKLKELSEAGKVELVIPYQLKALKGENGHLSSVTVATLQGDEKQVKVDHLLAFYGLKQNLGPIADWNLQLDRNLIDVDPATCMSNQEGIYAIGDIATYQNKLKLILSGFHEAAMCAHDIWRKTHPDTELHFQYSTSKGLPE